MKLKQFLCLTLATTMTFTATLSSSASIFADDAESPKTEESQSFASKFFDELVTLSEDTNNENQNDYQISPMWLKEDHDDIIDANVVLISEEKRTIMKHCSEWADTCFKATNPTVVSVPGLHGPGNYVINLKFLWYFAIYLGKKDNPTSTSDMDNKINAAKNSAVEKIKGTKGYNTSQLQDLIKKSGTLVKYNGAKMQNDTLLKSAKMKTRILGYAAHLVGDVYSHRTILPDTKDLTMSLFTSNLATDVAKGIVEYRFLGKLPKDGGYLLNEKDKKHVNETCIDSPYYRPNRYNDATADVSDMITRTAENFDYYAFIVPWSNDVKLSKLKQYVKNSGLDTSRLTESEWAKFST